MLSPLVYLLEVELAHLALGLVVDSLVALQGDGAQVPPLELATPAALVPAAHPRARTRRQKPRGRGLDRGRVLHAGGAGARGHLLSPPPRAFEAVPPVAHGVVRAPGEKGGEDPPLAPKALHRLRDHLVLRASPRGSLLPCTRHRGVIPRKLIPTVPARAVVVAFLGVRRGLLRRAYARHSSRDCVRRAPRRAGAIPARPRDVVSGRQGRRRALGEGATAEGWRTKGPRERALLVRRCRCHVAQVVLVVHISECSVHLP
mmetsp:Transcript_19630/g.52964  ORF Transcript_19630/g.52964 Transcript_19630/m.52964 type:complete len:259 (-) Transcript_19630:524-1300(-)